MYKIVEEFDVKKDGLYVLTLDKELPFIPYTYYKIGGIKYKPVSVTGSRRWIALKGNGSFVGKNVEFVSE
ncbi:MAG: hypothetical protein J6M62_09915 [Selenomonadaceae bacterium]|nr:hypothetical protein [Selenomonadaceae bacterium]MBP3723038.1 hypothetical protein [Selenomonadaceae bacterium]